MAYFLDRFFPSSSVQHFNMTGIGVITSSFFHSTSTIQFLISCIFLFNKENIVTKQTEWFTIKMSLNLIDKMVSYTLNAYVHLLQQSLQYLFVIWCCLFILFLGPNYCCNLVKVTLITNIIWGADSISSAMFLLTFTFIVEMVRIGVIILKMVLFFLSFGWMFNVHIVCNVWISYSTHVLVFEYGKWPH